MDVKLMEFRVEKLEEAVSETSRAVRSIDESLKTLTQLEVHHSQTREAVTKVSVSVEKLEDRVTAVEKEQAVIQENLKGIRTINKYICTGVVGLLGIVGTQVLKAAFGWS